MHLNTLRLQRLVLSGLVLAIIFSSVLAASSYYFFFRLLEQEASLLGEASVSSRTIDLNAGQEVGWVVDRVEKKRSIPSIRREDVVDAFSLSRVPGRE
ncbi:MAG: hypothetical protein AAB554_05585 [Patescibacteria group bacterium]